MRILIFLVSAALMTACADAPAKTDAPRFDALAAAKADGPVIAGALGATDGVATGQLSAAAPRQTWTLDVRPGAVIDLEITHKGTTAALDTLLTVVGPVAGDDATTPVVAEDDDSGWGLHSRLKQLSLPGDGGSARFLVTVQSYDGKQAGKYRLVATCRSGQCEPQATGVATDDRFCHPTLDAAVRACVDDQLVDPDRDPATWTALDIGRACADAEPLGRPHDQVCANERPAPSWCALDYEAFVGSQGSLCEERSVAYALGRECVFGAGFHDLADGRSPLTVTGRRVIAAGSALDALETEQLIAAVRVAYEDAADLAGALDSVDGGEVNQLRVWDATARRGFVAYEYGAGDNSYGAVIADGSATIVTEIHDGDFYLPGGNGLGCPAAGDELRACADDGGCAAGLRCIGVVAGRGRCAAPGSVPGETAPCHVTDVSNGCGGGLVCAGVDANGDGLCLPAWQRAGFDDYAVASIPAHGKVERKLTAWGLTTVSTDVDLRLYVDGPSAADLRVTLTNPAGTVGVVYDGAAAFDEVRAVRAFPGDESANGEWVLTIDNRGATPGTLVSWGLDIMSRWD